MKVTLYMAITADGFIATKDDDTSWVSELDWQNFSTKIEEAGVIIVGNKTYKVGATDGTFPYQDTALHIVLNHDQEQLNDKLWFTTMEPKALLANLKEKGYERVLIAGGGLLNGSFLKDNLIDEIILSVHPTILGDGISLFEGIAKQVSLELVEVKQMEESLLQLRYRIVKEV